MSVSDVAVGGVLFFPTRCASRRAVVVATDELLAALVSSRGLVAVTVAVLAIGPVAAGLMCTTIVKGWVASAASVPKLQVTMPEMGRASGREGEKLTGGGGTWATVP